ncbi:MAG: hypothetical protein AAF298_00240 [Cyanobacteria bacterium P01_A01_bin.40]
MTTTNDFPLEAQIEQQIAKIDSLYTQIKKAKDKNLAKPHSLQTIWTQLSQEQQQLAHLQLQHLNQK